MGKNEREPYESTENLRNISSDLGSLAGGSKVLIMTEYMINSTKCLKFKYDSWKPYQIFLPYKSCTAEYSAIPQSQECLHLLTPPCSTGGASQYPGRGSHHHTKSIGHGWAVSTAKCSFLPPWSSFHDWKLRKWLCDGHGMRRWTWNEELLCSK